MGGGRGNVDVRVSLPFYCRRRKGNVEVSLLWEEEDNVEVSLLWEEEGGNVEVS